MSRSVRLGVFIVAGLAILATGSFLIGDRRLLFSRKVELQTTFTRVAGLTDGAPVRVGGIQKGVVKRLELPSQPSQQVAVLMQLERDTLEVLRSDSQASIETEGLLGAKYVEVSFGSANGSELEDGATIAGVPPIEMADVMRKTTTLLDTVATGSVQFAEIAEKINRGTGTLGALVNDRSTYAELNAATRQAKEGAVSFQENMQALKRNFFVRGFFKDRGYDDSSRLLEDAIARLPSAAPAMRFSYESKAIFDAPDNAKIKNPKPLREAGQYLEQNPFELVVIAAASGMKGDSDQMLVLSQARAMVLRDYLVANFKMADTRVKTLARGKTQSAPVDGGIEILIYPPSSAPPARSK
jgi:phospholipid/cholesterol/gamma-HCH transport system substrate-binding protein